MEITAALAADLALLSEALGESDGAIADALARLVADVKLAVRSYLGLTIIARNASSPLTLTAMEDLAVGSDIATSLLMPLSDGTADRPADGAAGPVTVILYADRPGAFVDLAADLSWLTGRDLGDFALDQHLDLPGQPWPDGSLSATSLVNQAIGVLIGRGHTPEQAELELRTRAAAAGHELAAAARSILDTPRLDPTEPDAGH